MADNENEKDGFYHDHGDGKLHYHSYDYKGSLNEGSGHEMTDEQGNGLSQGHEHGHVHGHTHTQTKAVINRLSRAMGHLESVKKMVEEGRDCSEVLIQLAAVRAALTNTGKVILKDHIEHCMIDAVENNDYASIEELNNAIERFLD